MTHTQTTRKMAANEGGRGNLAGTEINCTCGHQIRTSLDSEVLTLIYEHLDYMNRIGDKRRLHRLVAAKAAATRKRNADPFGFKAAGLTR